MYYRHDLNHRQYTQWESCVSIHEMAYHRELIIAEARLAANGERITIHSPNGREIYRDIPPMHHPETRGKFGPDPFFPSRSQSSQPTFSPIAS